MHLVAALVPPPDVLAEVETLVQRVPTEAGAGDPATTGAGGRSRSLLSRVLGREQPAPVATATAEPELTHTRPGEMHALVANLGNLTKSDAVRVTDALRAAAVTWPRPRLRLSGGAALEWPGDTSVWACLEGDEERVATIARGVPEAVQRLSLFVDRRRFHPFVPVGRITDATTAPYLERVVAALDDFAGAWWQQATLSVLRPTVAADGRPAFDLVEDLPLGPG